MHYYTIYAQLNYVKNIFLISFLMTCLHASKPYSADILEIWNDALIRGQLALSDKSVESLINAKAGLEQLKLQKKLGSLYRAVTQEIDKKMSRPSQAAQSNSSEVSYIASMLIESVPKAYFLQGKYDLHNYETPLLESLASFFKKIIDRPGLEKKKSDIALLIGVIDQVLEMRKNGEPVHRGPRIQFSKKQETRPVVVKQMQPVTVGFAYLEKWDRTLRQNQKINLATESKEMLQAAIAFIESKGQTIRSEYAALYTLLKEDLKKRGETVAQATVQHVVQPIATAREQTPGVYLIDIMKLPDNGLCPLFQGIDDTMLRSYGLARKIPCVKSVTEDVYFIQLPAVNQFRLEEFGYATCPVQSLRSIALVLQYATTGKVQFLKDLASEANARQFLQNIAQQGFTTNWLDRDFLERVKNEARIQGLNDKAKVNVVDNVLELDPRAQSFFTAEELSRSRTVKQIIRQGLKKETFVHGLVVGTADAAMLGAGEPRIHFFALVIIKKGPVIQYVIVDTAPVAYHLRGYEFDRLQYLTNLLVSDSAVTGFAKNIFGN